MDSVRVSDKELSENEREWPRRARWSSPRSQPLAIFYAKARLFDRYSTPVRAGVKTHE